MDIHEYQNKRFFKEHKLPILNGNVAYTPEEAGEIAEQIGGKAWQIKVQIHDVNRSAGYFTDADTDEKSGVQTAFGIDEVIKRAEKMLGHPFLTPSMQKAQIVRRIYVEEVCQAKEKLNVSVRIDFARHAYVIAVEKKGKLKEFEIPHLKPSLLFWYKVLRYIDVSGLTEAKLMVVLRQMFSLFENYNAICVEFRPLALTLKNNWVIEDGRIVFDNEAVNRFSEVVVLKETPEGNERQALAQKYNFRYTPFDGNIACLVNGSGLGGATVELLRVHNGRPACLLDVGTEPTGDSVARAFKLALSEPNVDGVFINIFGGLTRCDTIAQGLIEASREISGDIPLVVRMDGTNARIGERLLFESRLPFVVIKKPEEAVKAIINAVGELS